MFRISTRNTSPRWFGVQAAGLLFLVGVSGAANAAAIISNGDVALGVQDTGALNVSHSSVTPPFPSSGGAYSSVNGTGVRGLFANSPEGYEATYPGCTCEGWGAAIASLGITGYDGNGTSNVSVVSFTSTATTANSVVTIANGGGTPVLRVTHDFKPSASRYLYQVDVTLENISGGDLGSGATDLRYTRLMDWDTEPTPFSEFVTLQGWPATNLLNSSDDGFEPANPLFATSSIAACAPEGANFVDCGPADHGARFDFGFDALLGTDNPDTADVDETMRSFTIFYGAAPSEALADLARAVVGAEVYSYGQCNVSGTLCTGGADSGTPATFIFAFAGVGGTAPPPPPDGGGTIPEPGVFMMMSIGLVGLIWSRKRKQLR